MEAIGGTTIRFQVLGPFEVLVDGQAVQVGGPKQRAIMATLALRSNEVVSTDGIVHDLWGEQAPRSPRELIRTYVSRLRGAISGAEGVRLVASAPGYVLRVEPATVDAHRFERLVDEARREREAGRLDDAVSTLNRGLALWRGHVLADLTEFPSFRPEIARLEEMRLAALEQRIDTDLALGHHTQVLGELAALTTEHPLRERFWGQLVVALYRSGRQTDALGAYQTLRSTLVEQIGIDPSPELRELEHEVLNQAEALSWRPVADRSGRSRSGSVESGREAPSADGPEGAANDTAKTYLDGGALVEWPLQVGRPPTRAAAFQPRKTLVDEVDLTATDAESTVLPQVVLVGNGGVGKTQLAADKFSEARREGTELLVWVNASSRRSIIAAYVQARQEIEPSAPRSESADDAAEAFLGWLGATSRSWLVVLDDVVDPLDVHGLWPEGRSGRVLATTRRRDLSPAGARQVAVEGFTPSDAYSYLQTRLTGSPARPVHPDVLDEGAMMAEDLGWLPVALAQASAVILNDGITCAGFRRRFADRAEDLGGLLPSDAAADDYHDEVSTAWSLALERADALDPAGLSRPALHLAAVLDPGGAPDSVWEAPSVLRFLSGQRSGTGELRTEVATPESSSGEPAPGVPAALARRALRNLHRLSLVTHDPAGGPHAVRTHALVQRATVESLDPAVRAKLVQVASDALLEVWPPANDEPDLLQALWQNAATLAARDDEALWVPGAHEVLFRAGESLTGLGRIQDAVRYWTDLEGKATRHLGPDHSDTLAVRRHVADCQGESGDAAAAITAFEELVAQTTRVLGADHPDTLATRHLLASWRGASGDGGGAVEALRALVDDRSRVLGADHPDTFATRTHLANWQGAAGDAAGAVEELKKLIEDRSRASGHDHPDTFATRSHLAEWQGKSGDVGSAVDSLTSLVDEVTRTLGADSPDTFETRHFSVTWLGTSGDAAGAVEELKRLIEDRSRASGHDHPETLRYRFSLAHWQGVSGDPSGAAEALETLVEERSLVLGSDHPDTLTTRHGQTWWTGVAGDAPAAVDALETLIDDCVRLLGPDHRHTLGTRNHLEFWRGMAGEAKSALERLEDLADDHLRVLGPDHRQTLTTRNHVAHWRGVAGDPGRASEELETLLADCVRVLGTDHPDVRAIRSSLSDWRRESSGSGADATGEPQLPEFDQMHLLAERLGLADWRLGRRWLTRSFGSGRHRGR